MKKILSISFAFFMIVAVCPLETWFDKLAIKQANHGPHCAPPRDSFTEADLVGIWIAGSPDQRDTLIIKPDGMYKQIIHIEFAELLPPVDYESAWQAWWLEDYHNSVPVLHLEGWRMCGYNPDVSCDTPGGSGVHMCDVDYKDDPDEGALYVMGGRELTLTLPLLENSWFYYQPNH